MRIALVLMVLLSSASAPAANRETRMPAELGEYAELHEQGREVADALGHVAGVQLNPLLGITALGALRYAQATTAERAGLPWYQQPPVFGLGLAVMLVLWLGHWIPGVRHFAKQLKLWESHAAAMLSSPVVAKGFAVAFAVPAARALAWAGEVLVPSAHADTRAAAAAVIPSQLGEGLAFAAGLVVAVAVWLAGHAINVLVVLSPFQPIDMFLKWARLGSMALVLACCKLSPALGAAVALIYIAVALLIAGWSFRLAVFGLVYSSDILTLRGRRTRIEGPLRAFASELSGVPARTLGTVSSSAEGVVFNYRPWLVLPRRTIGLGREGLVLVKGLLGPVLQQARDQERVLLRLPPRFARHSEAVGSALGGILVIEHPVVRGFRAAWGWLRAQLRRRPRAAQVTLSS